MPALLITGGRVLDPARGFDATADVLVRDDRIAAIDIAPGAIDDASAVRIDAEGLLVVPGLIDPHVHLREPDPSHEETIATGAASAVRGGYTTVCCMPNTNPPLDRPASVRFVQQRAGAARLARVFVVACATRERRGEAPAPLHALADAGAVGFTDDGAVIDDPAVMVAVLREARALDRPVMQHAQDPRLSAGGVLHDGPLARRLGLAGWPREAEEIVVERDLRLDRAVGARYHVQHVSSAGTVDLLRRARAEGLAVSGEASPHHLLLTVDACDGYDAMAKMNPPLRDAADVEALRRGVADGTITVLATDHAPHPMDRKRTDFASAAFGIVGLDCALPLYARALVESGVVDWPRLVALLTIEPARLVGLDRLGLGRLDVGGPADLTLIDPEAEWTIDPEEFAGAGRNCPFAGWPARGRAMATIVGGRVRYQGVGDRLTVVGEGAKGLRD